MKRNKNKTEATGPTVERAIAAYVRVSSLRQAMDGDSLEAQQKMIADYVRHHLQKDPTGIIYYVERARSGKNQNRPELQRLRRDIEAGRVGTVMAFKLDRITRSPGDFDDLWKFFSKHNVEMITLRERFDTSTPIGRAMLDIALVFARMEREQTAERTIAVMQDRIERGLCSGGIRWGYKHDDAQNGRLIRDADWAPIIQEHFFNTFERMGAAGAVQRHLQKIGIFVPKRVSADGKVRGGKPFTKQQVIRVLSNEVYLGTLTWGEVRKEGCHEALVTQEQFNRVQKALARNRHTSTHKDPQGQYPFLLKGILRCKCGHMMTSYSSTGRSGQIHYYYACTNRTHRGLGTCNGPYLSAPAIDEAVVTRVLELAGDQQAQDRIISMAIGLADDDGRRTLAEIDNVQRRIGEVQTEINNLVRALKTMGEGAVTSVQDALKECEAEKEGLKETLGKLNVERESLGKITEDAENFLQAWRRVRDMFHQANPATQRSMILHFVESLDWIPADPKGKSGTYRLTFFPEVMPDRGDQGNQPHDDGGNNGGEGAGKPSPETKYAPLLRAVRESVRKAPRVGLEPTTFRLTAGCSTIELSRNISLFAKGLLTSPQSVQYSNDFSRTVKVMQSVMAPAAPAAGGAYLSLAAVGRGDIPPRCQLR